MAPKRTRRIRWLGIEPLEPRTVPSCVVNTAYYQLWPTNQIPYIIDPSEPDPATVLEAVNEYNDETNLQWVPRTTQPYYVDFTKGSEGVDRADIGFAGRPQNVWIIDDSPVGTVLHEMGHSLGLQHEQQRNDASSNIIINYQNIIPGYADQFTPVGAAGIDVGPFDFSSIMLYWSYDFSAGDQPTMTRLDGTTWDYNSTLSAEDISTLNSLYPVRAGQAQVPRQVAAVPVSANQIRITWADTNAGQATYTVERALASQALQAPFQVVATLPAGSTSYDDQVTPGTLYDYLILATTVANVPAVSAIVPAATQSAPTLAASSNTSGGITLSWGDPYSGQASYILEDSVNGGPFSTLVFLGPGTTSYSLPDWLVQQLGGSKYTFRVHAQLGQDTVLWVSDESNTVTLGRLATAQTTISTVSGRGTYGSTATLTATLTAGDTGLPNQSVTFTLINGGSSSTVGLARTDANGVATLNGVSLAGIVAGTCVGCLSASFPGDANYGGSSGIGNLDIAKATLTVTANEATKVAGQPNPGFSVQYSGFVLGQGPTVLDGTLTFSTPATSVSPAGSYPLIPGGLSSPNYAIRFVAGTLLVTPPNWPVGGSGLTPVAVTGLQWQTLKLKHGKALNELVIDFSGALDPGTADDLGAYVLHGAKRVKKRGLVYIEPVPLASASYNPANHSVTLALRGQVPKQGAQLTINADLVRDAAGQPLDGNHDDQAGGNFVATLNARGVLSMARPMAEPRAGRVTYVAINALMAAESSPVIIRNEHRHRREAF